MLSVVIASTVYPEYGAAERTYREFSMRSS